MAVLETNKLITPTGVVSGNEQVMQTVPITIDPSTGDFSSDAEVKVKNLPVPTVFYNDTGVEIAAGKWINGGPGVADGVIKGFLADSSTPPLATSVIGFTLAAVPNGSKGIAYCGAAFTADTSGLSAGVPLYLSTSGDATNTRPKYPNTIVILGTVQTVGVTGSVLCSIQRFSRQELTRNYTFTSTGILSGTYWSAGFYDWNTTSVTLTQAGTTQTYGVAGRTYAAHAGIVPNVPGTVDTGQVGLRVTGTQDSETGAQTAAQTGIITEDITTLTANVMAETSEKFSGQITFELYVVSGTPTTYGLSFNYGLSKYEDFYNKDFSVDAIEAVWQGNGNDSAFNIELLHHKAAGWTYAASGFVAGDSAIAVRLTDQQIESDVGNGFDGAWKHSGLATYVNGSTTEGIILRITTGSPSTIQIANINVTAFSEELT